MPSDILAGKPEGRRPLRRRRRSIIKSIEALLQAGRKVVLEEHAEETKYMVVSRHKNVGQNHNLLFTNKFFEYVAKFKCLERAVTNQNCIHEEIKSSLNTGNTCYHCVQNLFSCLISKNLKNNS